jgi:hypothetical protein
MTDNHCSGSGFIGSRYGSGYQSGSSISSESECGSGSTVLMTKNWKKKIWVKTVFYILMIKTCNFLIPGPSKRKNEKKFDWQQEKKMDHTLSDDRRS